MIRHLSSLFLILSFISVLHNKGVLADEISIPDMNFEEKVRDLLGLTGLEPVNKKQLKGIKKLDISGSGIHDLTGLEHFTELVYLNIAGNNITNISSVSSLITLEELHMCSNGISNLEPLKNIQTLKVIWAQRNQIENLAPLSNLKKLDLLLVNSNNISNPGPLNNLPSLNSIALDDNKIEDLSALSNLPDLYRISLSSNSISNLEPLSHFDNLGDLNLSHNQISNLNGIQHLSNLRSLKLSSNQISNLSLLKNLKKIRTLELRNNIMSDLSTLPVLPELKSIYLSNNHITDIAPLKKHSTLEMLSLSGNCIKDITPLLDLPALQLLDVNKNPLTDAAIHTHIPQFKEKGIQISFFTYSDNNCAQPVLDQPVTKLENEYQDGDFVWAKSFGGNNDDIANALTVNKNTDIYITGEFSESLEFNRGTDSITIQAEKGEHHRDAFIAKFNQDGNCQWGKRIGGGGRDVGNDIACGPKDSIYVTGTCEENTDFGVDPSPVKVPATRNIGGDIFVLKLDNSGKTLWAKQMGGSFFDEGKAIAVDETGNAYITGFFNMKADFDPGEDNIFLQTLGDDVFVTKLDVNGDFCWARQFNSQGQGCGSCIALDQDEKIIVTGYFSFSTDFGSEEENHNLTAIGRNDMFIVKMNNKGNIEWTRQLGGRNAHQGMLNIVKVCVAIDKHNNIYISSGFTGTVDFNPGPDTAILTAKGGRDLFVLKLDNNGDFCWVRHFERTENIKGPGDKTTSIAVDSDDNLCITGSFAGTIDFDPGPESYTLTSSRDGYNNEMFYLKMDKEGNLISAKHIAAASILAGPSIALDNSGNPYMTGPFSSRTDFDPGDELYRMSPVGATDFFLLKLRGASAKQPD